MHCRAGGAIMHEGGDWAVFLSVILFLANRNGEAKTAAEAKTKTAQSAR